MGGKCSIGEIELSKFISSRGRFNDGFINGSLGTELERVRTIAAEGIQYLDDNENVVDIESLEIGLEAIHFLNGESLTSKLDYDTQYNAMTWLAFYPHLFVGRVHVDGQQAVEFDFDLIDVPITPPVRTINDVVARYQDYATMPDRYLPLIALPIKLDSSAQLADIVRFMGGKCVIRDIKLGHFISTRGQFNDSFINRYLGYGLDMIREISAHGITCSIDPNYEVFFLYLY